MMLQRQAFLLPFVICLVASAAILWFWRTRNPVKIFRPPAGAVFLGGVILTMVSAGVAFFVANTVLSGDEVVQQFKESQKKEKYASRADQLIDADGRGGSWDRIMANDPDADPRQAEQEAAAAAQQQRGSFWGGGSGGK